MNTSKYLVAVVFTASIFFNSCEKDDKVAKPEITIHELGDGDSHGNDHTAKIGGNLHMDINVVAEGKIDYIRVRIHPEEAHHEEGDHEEWELDTFFSGTGITGLKNTSFHEHVEIDTTAEAGEYHFDFVVTDMEGNQGSAEAELQLVENNH